MGKKLLILALLGLIVIPATGLTAVIPNGGGGADGGNKTACPAGKTCIQPPVKWTNFNDLINKLIDFVFYISVVVLPLIIMYGGFKFVTAQGDPNQVKEAQKMLIWAGIGFLIMLLAKGAVNLIDTIFINPPAGP